MPDLRNKPADLIYGKGIVTAEAIASELRRRLARDLTTQFLTEWQLLDRARAILSEFEPIMAESLLNVDLAAWIAGFEQVQKKLPEWALPIGGQGDFREPPTWRGTSIAGGNEEPVLRFPVIERAADSLFEKRIVSRAEFDALTDAAKQRAFTIAGDMTERTIEKVRDTLRESIQYGTSLDDFKARLGPELESSFIGPGHLETVFRTNTQAAFAEGHEAIASDQIVSELFPYQAYLPIHDARTRPEHEELGTLGLNGTNVYRRDDPVWDLFTPPWDYNCRCGVNLMTVEAAARAGVKEAQVWLATGKPPLIPEWCIDKISFRPPAGFVGGRRRVAA